MRVSVIAMADRARSRETSPAVGTTGQPALMLVNYQSNGTSSVGQFGTGATVKVYGSLYFGGLNKPVQYKHPRLLCDSKLCNACCRQYSGKLRMISLRQGEVMALDQKP